MTDQPEKEVEDEGKAEPKPKRRWYQYSLRSLVVVMVLFCILFAWVGYKVRKARRQRAAVVLLEEELAG